MVTTSTTTTAAGLIICKLLIQLLLILSSSVFSTGATGLGINYGQIADNLPSPLSVAALLKTLNITRVKLYDANSAVLLAFANTGIEFTVGLGNEYLHNMTDTNKAHDWIRQNLQPHLPQTKITSVVVGNEVYGGTDTQLYSYLLPAMQSVYVSLSKLGLGDRVKVTTAHSLNILSNSYPPSSGSFRSDLASYIQPLLNFHSQIDAPFLINAYPYFAYKGSPNEISLPYVLFEPNQTMTDPNTGLEYDNMLFAQIDAVYAAIKALGHSDIEVRVSETGWPSKGDADEVGANPRNAGLYNGNVLRRVEMRQGTPAKPDVPIDVHVFALFNENMKPGPTSERNYGLFYPNESAVYNIGLRGGGYLPDPELLIKPPSSSSTVLDSPILILCTLYSLRLIIFLRT